MNKNTVWGMLLIGLLLFTWMYCNKPQPQAGDDNPQTAARDSALIAQAQERDAAEITTGAYRDKILTYINKYGTMATGADSATVRTLENRGVSLTLTADTALAGTVAANDTRYDIDRILDAKDLNFTPAERLAVAGVLSESFAKYDKYGPLMAALEAPGQTIMLQNEKVKVYFDTKGGCVSKVVLKDYTTELTDPATPIVLFDGQNSTFGIEFTTATQKISTADLTFNPVVAKDSMSIAMTLPVNDGAYFTLTYTLDPDSYLVHVQASQKDMSSFVPANRTGVKLTWTQNMTRFEKGRSFEERNSGIYYKVVSDGPDELSAYSAEDEKLDGAAEWVAFKNQFFSSVIIPRQPFKSARAVSVPVPKDQPRGQVYLKDLLLEADMAYSSENSQPFAFDFYFGPNDYPLLGTLDEALKVSDTEDRDLELNRLVPLGWGIFGWINRFITIPVFEFLGSFDLNYGIIILLLTIFIKIILFPLTYKSLKSQAKMRLLAPRIKAINEKYPDKADAMKRQQETMKIYSQAGASPFSGCLPLLLQMPVLIALFSFFPSAIELRGQSFLWVHDLSAPDYICTLPFTIPFYGNQVSLFCLLMTVTNIVYTRISMASNPSTGMGGMKWMSYLMPVMFLFFFNDYAAGLSYYYFLSLLITIAMTYAFRYFYKEEKLRKEMEAHAQKNKGKKKSGFMARLEAAQKRQEAMMREQRNSRK